MELKIDIEQLKKDLIDYFGSAVPYNGVAIMDVIAVEHADAEELVNIALQNGFNLDDYVGGLKL